MAEVNLPVAALIWLMIVPMLLKIDFAVGIQSDTEEGLVALRARLEPADISGTEQRATACCCARSDKYWVQDPQGIAWETFHTLDSIPTFGDGQEPAQPERKGAENACCVCTSCSRCTASRWSIPVSSLDDAALASGATPTDAREVERST